jgi:3-deoxy-D-arabino-heptulosonate 7-phosphate (DAHP) synthase
VHPNPAEAMSDGQQQVDFNLFDTIMADLPPFLKITGRDPDQSRIIEK